MMLRLTVGGLVIPVGGGITTSARVGDGGLGRNSGSTSAV